MRSPSQHEIADKAGVSRSTVAWALSPALQHRLRPETVRRVERAIKNLNYRPHRHAQMLRSGRSGVIGIMYAGGIAHITGERVNRMVRSVRVHGFKPMVVNSMWATENFQSAFEELLDVRIEGLIVEGPHPHYRQQLIESARRADFPIVVLSGTELPSIPQVRADFQTGMKELVRHIIRIGHRRLMFLLNWLDPKLSLHDLWRNIDKAHGLVEALREADGVLRGDAETIQTLFPDNGSWRELMSRRDAPITCEIYQSRAEHDWLHPYQDGRHAMEEILCRGSLPDVVLCVNDEWAIGASAACAKAGVRIPQDMAITGFDNDPAGELLGVPLTTVSQPAELQAETAVDLILDMIEGKRHRNSDDIIRLPTQLIVRESCGSKKTALE